METKNKRPALERIQRALHFKNNCYVDPEGTSGGLALWWTDEVNLDIRFKTKNIIRAVVSSPSLRFDWVTTFIYAPPKRQERALFWKSLVKMGQESLWPWLCIGAFNEVGSATENKEGLIVVVVELKDFSLFYRSVLLWIWNSRVMRSLGPIIKLGKRASKKELTEPWQTWSGA